ncbi:MAG: hypothetical protein VB036_13130 [Propionicimonas sp.]|nr:hypothetical protein [Propionicimonas sp.]
MSAVTDPQPAVAASAASSGGRRRRSRAALVTGDRGVLSESDRRSPAVAVSLGVINVVLFVLLVVACLGP